MEEIIEFVKTSPLYNGDEDGNGSEDGYGSGSGNGYGYGYGNGNGYGYGNGNGNGDGDGRNLKSLNNQRIFIIDYLQTIVTSVKNNIAKGFIVQNDLTLTPCFIAKGENTFAHGNSVKDAVSSLQKKLLLNLPITKRIIKFKEKFTDATIKYPALDFYEWHHFLTGSCDTGRASFVKDHNINIDRDSFTVVEFIKLVKNSYGQSIIQDLEESYK